MEKENSEQQYPNAVVMEWTVHPVKKNWKTSVCVVSFLLILCVSIYFSFESATYLIISTAILFVSLLSFFFPTTYILQDDCIIVKTLLRRFSRQWSSFKSCYPDKNGVLLSPFLSPSRLENFRGIYVRFSHNRSEVLDYIRSKIKVTEDQE